MHQRTGLSQRADGFKHTSFKKSDNSGKLKRKLYTGKFLNQHHSK